MKATYRKPAIKKMELDMHDTMLVGSAKLKVNWDDEPIDAGSANARQHNSVWDDNDEK